MDIKQADMQKPFENTKVVFFDLDDTLWAFTENSRVALEKTYYAFNRPYWACDYATFSDIYHRHNTDLWERYSQGLVEVDFLKSERFRVTLEAVAGNAECLPLAKEMDAYYLDNLSSLPLLVPDAKYILEYLKSRGYRIGILSNGFKGVQQRKLEHSGIERFIDYIVLSEDIGISKPQRGIFDAALQVCGCGADEVVMIGDNPVTDIKGALDAGWPAIYLNRKGDAPTASCGVTVNSLREIESLL